VANWDNQHTKTEQERVQSNLENGIVDGDAFATEHGALPVDPAGVDDGLAFLGYPLPGFGTKPFYRFTAYERGFALGWMIQGWLKDKF
jgi:hypothetical protein